MRDKPTKRHRQYAAVAHWVGSYNETQRLRPPPVGAHPVRDKPSERQRRYPAAAQDRPLQRETPRIRPTL